LVRSLSEKFGAHLIAFREAEGLSLGDFATLLGLDRQALELAEQGQPDIKLETVEVIAATLGIEPLLLLE